MIKYNKNSWPQLTLGARKTRRCWPGLTHQAHWAEICYDPGHRIMGHIGWVAFWLNRTHLTLAIGPYAKAWGKSTL